VYRAVQNDDVFAKAFIIPMSVNGILSKCLRDTGCSASVLADKSLVDAEQYVPNKSVLRKGIFDSTYTELPVARVCLRSPRFGEDKNIVTESAVTAFSDSIDCIICNKFFRERSDLRDIINLAAPLSPAATVETITHRENAPRSRDEREPVAATAQPTSLMDDTPIKAGTDDSLMELRYSNETQPQLGKESTLRPLSDAITGHDNVTKTNDRLE